MPATAPGSEKNSDRNKNQNQKPSRTPSKTAVTSRATSRTVWDDDGEGRQGRRGRRFRDRRRRGDGPPRGEGGNGETELRDDDVVQPVAGILDALDNYAFVRTSGYLAGPNDVYVSMNMVRKNGLRRGDAITGASAPLGRRVAQPAGQVQPTGPTRHRQRRPAQDRPATAPTSTS